MTAYAFSFVSTQRDLLDGFDAERTLRTGMRRSVRAAVAGVGLVFLFAVALLGRQVPAARWWQPMAWLLIGVLLTWQFAVRPLLAARHIRSSNQQSQPLTLRFDDDGISVEAAGVGQFTRSWNEVLSVVPAKRGIIMRFAGGMEYWLPNRVFSTAVERAAFVRYVSSKIPLVL